MYTKNNFDWKKFILKDKISQFYLSLKKNKIPQEKFNIIMQIRFSKKDINYFFFISIILTYWINIELFLIVRISDVLLLMYAIIFLFMKQYKKSEVNIYFKIFLVLLVVGIFFGLSNIDEIKPSQYVGAVFYYKYTIFFGLLWIVLSADLDVKQRNSLIKYLFLSYLGLVLFVLIRTPLYILNMVGGWPRPDFPFTKPEEATAGHLFGAYFVTGFISLMAYLPKAKNRKKFLLLIVCAGVAIILTGSRGPILALALIFIVFLLKNYVEKTIKKPKFEITKFSLHLILIFLILVLLMIFFFIKFENNLGWIADRVVKRTFDVEIGGQYDSLTGRFEKAKKGLEFIKQSYYFFGAGAFVWGGFFDNSISRILTDSGFLGLIVFSIFIGNALLQAGKKNNMILFYSLLAIVFANITAEFWLVSRYSIPAALLLGLLNKENKYVSDKYNYSSI